MAVPAGLINSGGTLLSEHHLISAIVSRFHRMRPTVRRRKVREFVSEASGNKEFIRQHFPDLYREAFRSQAAVNRIG